MNKFEITIRRTEVLRSVHNSAKSTFCDVARWNSDLIDEEKLGEDKRWDDEAIIAALTDDGKELFKIVGEIETALLKLV